MSKILLILIFIICPFLIFPQNNSNDIRDEQSQWEFDVTPYVWFTNLSADILFLERSVDVNENA